MDFRISYKCFAQVFSNEATKACIVDSPAKNRPREPDYLQWQAANPWPMPNQRLFRAANYRACTQFKDAGTLHLKQRTVHVVTGSPK